MVELCPCRAHGSAGIPQSDRTRRTVGCDGACHHRWSADRAGSAEVIRASYRCGCVALGGCMRILWIALIFVFSDLPPLCHSQVAGRQPTENDVEADALNKEKLAWEFTKKKDKAGLAELLSEDFTEITEDGVFETDQ